MIIRDATPEDVQQISAFLKELTASGKRTRPDDEAFVLTSYVEDPDKISCAVAEEDGVILGFQSLKWAVLGNQWDVEPGWALLERISSPLLPVAAWAARCSVSPHRPQRNPACLT